MTRLEYIRNPGESDEAFQKRVFAQDLETVLGRSFNHADRVVVEDVSEDGRRSVTLAVYGPDHAEP